jgi:hypothetical protein
LKRPALLQPSKAGLAEKDEEADKPSIHSCGRIARTRGA